MTTRSDPKRNYDFANGILRVIGDDFYYDLNYVRELIDAGEIPRLSLDTIIHEARHVGIPMLIRGQILSKWLTDGSGCPDWCWHLELKARRSV